MISKKVLVVENTPICRKHDIYGWYDSNTKTMTLCTDRIKSGPNSTYYINETLYHESVHVAQACKKKPLGVEVALDAYKMNDVVRSVKVGNSYPVYESEGYFLEDKPEQVLYYLKKFCF